MNWKVSKMLWLPVAGAFAVNAFAADPCKDSMGHPGNGTTLTSSYASADISGTPYNYEIWYQGGNNSMTYYSNGTFSAKWSGTDDFLARVGLKYNSTKTHDQIGYFSADYSYTKSGTAGYGYIGVYGWTKDPEVEYYIVDDWFSKPSPAYLGTKMGELTVDGDTYDIYTYTRVNQPSISGTSTFPQFFSVRRNARQCGHIDISAHFKKWDEIFHGQKGDGGVTLKMGKMYEVKLLAEAGGNATGSVDYSYVAVTSDGSPSGVSSNSGASSAAASSSSSAANLNSSASVPRSAYSSHSIPGKIELENYDYGGQGVAYSDSDAENEGGEYRDDGVDIVGVGNGYGVGYTVAGEWLEYTVNVLSEGIYAYTLAASTGNAQPTSVTLTLDGAEIAKVTVPNTEDDWNTYSEINGQTGKIPAGEHVLRITFDDSYTNVDYISFAKEGETPIVGALNLQRFRGNAQVFDLQGRFLGMVRVENGNLRQAMKQKFARPGVFLVKMDGSFQKVKIAY